MYRVGTPLAAIFCLVLAGCGGGNKKSSDPVRNVPNDGGIQQKVKLASDPTTADFPPSTGKTLQQLADGMVSGPTLAMASSVFTTPGATRIAFGMIDDQGTPVYGQTAIYVAPTPGAQALGPFVA